jgi:replication-associated recombination protein RarA
MDGFRRSVEAFQNQGVMNIYWFIDDLDRLLKIPDDKRKVFMRELQVFIEGHANTPIAMLFASTSAAFEKLESEYPEVFSLIPRSSVLTIPPFELRDLKELVSRSLTKTGGEHSALLKPDDEALRLLLSMSEGNPRKIIQILNEAFYISSKTGRQLGRNTLKDLVSK